MIISMNVNPMGLFSIFLSWFLSAKMGRVYFLLERVSQLVFCDTIISLIPLIFLSSPLKIHFFLSMKCWGSLWVMLQCFSLHSTTCRQRLIHVYVSPGSPDLCHQSRWLPMFLISVNGTNMHPGWTIPVPTQFLVYSRHLMHICERINNLTHAPVGWHHIHPGEPFL